MAPPWHDRGPPRPVWLSPAQLPAALTRGSSSASLYNSTIRSTIYQLMLHSLDLLGEGKQGLPRPAWLPCPLLPSCHSTRSGYCKMESQKVEVRRVHQGEWVVRSHSVAAGIKRQPGLIRRGPRS